MAITDKEKEAIKTVVGMLNRRIRYIQENEPNATKKIIENYIAAGMILNLETLPISEYDEESDTI